MISTGRTDDVLDERGYNFGRPLGSHSSWSGGKVSGLRIRKLSVTLP